MYNQGMACHSNPAFALVRSVSFSSDDLLDDSESCWKPIQLIVRIRAYPVDCPILP